MLSPRLHAGPARVVADLGTLSGGQWHGAGPRATMIQLPARSSSPGKGRGASAQGLGGLSRGPSAWSVSAALVGPPGDVSIGVGSLDWGKA